ncbi:MAG: YeeE/YedE family protein [Nitrospirota bacterium]
MLLTEPYYLFAFNLLLGAVLGAVLYKSDYCMAGMFRDVFLFKQYSLLRSLLLLFVASMALFYVARTAGLVTLYPPPTYTYPSLATLFGGVVFGIGMVLSGGCVVGTLYKMAAGNLTSLVAFAGIIAGSLIYAESHPFWEAFRQRTVITTQMSLFEETPDVETVVVATMTISFLALFVKWRRQNKWRIEAFAEGYLQPWKAAIIIAVVNVLAYIFSGWPIGITTAYAKMGAYFENIFMPSRLATLTYFNQDSVVIHLAGGIISGGAGPRVDVISFTELPLGIGIVAGAFFTSVLLREFKIYGPPPRRQLMAALAGGMLIGLGTRIAKGCNIKFILGALPLFALQGIVFLFGMVAGTYVGVILLKRIVFEIEGD